MTNNLPAGNTSRKEAPMATITPSHRFAIADLATRARRNGNSVLAGLFSAVGQVEAFPESYTAQAVQLAEAIIADALDAGASFVSNVESFHSLLKVRAHIPA
jgi:hypothetical protein